MVAPLVLVVGSTGQVGTVIVRTLARRGVPVRALARPTSQHEHLKIPGVELVYGDLRDAASLDAACAGVGVVISTATVMVPRGSNYSFEQDEIQGYENLLKACSKHGVAQFIFPSVLAFAEAAEPRVPALVAKRQVEAMIIASGIPYSIFRLGPFMDDYFALIGSEIPLRGSTAATVRRPFWFMKFYRGRVGRMIEERGVAVTPGPDQIKNSFISVEDVARFLIAAIDHEGVKNKVFDVGGPEDLDWAEVAAIFSRVMGRPVRTFCSAPLTPFAVLIPALGLFSSGAANAMSVLWAMSRYDMTCDTSEVARLLGVEMQTAEQFLREKWALPDDAHQGAAS